MLVFDYGAWLDGSSRKSATVDGDGVVHEELDPDGGETDGSWASSSVIGRFAGKEELGAVHRKPGDNVSLSPQVPQEAASSAVL